MVIQGSYAGQYDCSGLGSMLTALDCIPVGPLHYAVWLIILSTVNTFWTSYVLPLWCIASSSGRGTTSRGGGVLPGGAC